MITHSDIEKLLGVRAAEPSVLSLYLRVPRDPSALRELPARVDELLAVAGRDGNHDGDARRALEEDRRIAAGMLEAHARDWLEHTVAIFACGGQRLAEMVVLPGAGQDRAVFATRPHVRPLLLALQRSPGYYVAVVDRQHAWVFRVAAEQIDAMATLVADGVRSHAFGGWYGLEARRVQDRVIQLARHHYHDTVAALVTVMGTGDFEPLVLGGHEGSMPRFFAMLPDDVRARFAGSFAADPHTMTPARVRALADEVVARWASAREQQVVTQVAQQRPGGLTAAGLDLCLAAVNQRAAKLLVVPESGMIPGFACQRCARLSRTGTDCPDWGAASIAVPDLIEEMTVAALGDGAQVMTVAEPPGQIAALLRFPLAVTGERVPPPPRPVVYGAGGG